MTKQRSKLPGVARIGIGGPVGSGKKALVERLIPVMKAHGINTHINTIEIAMIGPVTSPMAFRAASFDDKPCSK